MSDNLLNIHDDDIEISSVDIPNTNVDTEISSVPNVKVEKSDQAASTTVNLSSLHYQSTYSAENDITFIITPNTTELELTEWLK